MTKQIQLTRGMVALVDEQDYPQLSIVPWVATPKRDRFYAQRTVGPTGLRRTLAMHRVIMSAPRGVLVDHRNGDGLDNRRTNLRLCTHSQNQQNRRKSRSNSSGYKGVSPARRAGYRRLGGYVREATIAGGSFLRIDVPCEPPATQYYAPGAVYCVTPTTEETARRVATMAAPAPVQAWELPQLKQPAAADDDDRDEREGDDLPY